MRPRHEAYWWGGLTLWLAAISAWRYAGLDFSGVPLVGYVAEIAGNPYYGGNRPFSYRLLMPLIFNLTGYIPKPGEPWVPILGVAGMGLSLMALLRVMGINRLVSAAAVVLMSLASGLSDILKEFGVHNVDASCHILILLALCGMVRRNDALFSISSMLGVFNREWALVLLPGWYFYTYGYTLRAKTLLHALRVCGPTLALYAAMLGLYYPNTASGVISRELYQLLPEFRQGPFAFYGFIFERLGVAHWLESVFSLRFYDFAMGVLWPFAFLGWRRCPSAWRRFCLYYTLLCLAQFLVATDVWRLSFYLLPVVFSLFAFWLQAIWQQYGLNMLWTAGGVMLLFAFLANSLWGLPLSFALAAAATTRRGDEVTR